MDGKLVVPMLLVLLLAAAIVYLPTLFEWMQTRYEKRFGTANPLARRKAARKYPRGRD